MEDKSLEFFGQKLMKYVRDETISTWNMILEGKMKGLTAQEVNSKMASFNSEQIEVLKWMLPKIVDQNLHNMLFMIEENEEVFLGINSDNGKLEELKELSDGLAGELYTEDGWIQKFSSERYDEIE